LLFYNYQVSRLLGKLNSVKKNESINEVCGSCGVIGEDSSITPQLPHTSTSSPGARNVLITGPTKEFFPFFLPDKRHDANVEISTHFTR